MAKHIKPRSGGLKKPPKPKWEKMTAKEAGYPEVWWQNEKSIAIWRYMGVPISFAHWLTKADTKWGEIFHITIKKFDQVKAFEDRSKLFDSEEPTYAEKIQARQITRLEKCVALEVFPSEIRMLDAANLYHLWLLPEEFSLPFPIDLKENVVLTKQLSGNSFRKINYGEKQLQTEWGMITYYILEDSQKQELKWKQKQEFKNRVMGAMNTAAEFIPAKAVCSPYGKRTCLICFPEGFEFPFGLT